MLELFKYLQSLYKRKWFGVVHITYREGLIIKFYAEEGKNVAPFQAGWEQAIPGEE
jgi:hypothetical protein